MHYAPYTTLIKTMDRVIVFIFLIEFAVKVIAMGFMLPKHAYIHDAWNQLDFFLVLVSVYTMLFGSGVSSVPAWAPHILYHSHRPSCISADEISPLLPYSARSASTAHDPPFPQGTVHDTLCTIHYTHHDPPFPQGTVHDTLCTIHYTHHDPPFPQGTVHDTLCTIHYTHHDPPFPQGTVHDTLYTMYHTLYSS
jgi:hypothetical protein